MNDEELEYYLREHSAKEAWYLESISNDIHDVKLYSESQVDSKTGQETIRLESQHFMKPEEKIVISRQERYSSIAPHRHDFIELCYVWSGNCSQTVEGKQIKIRQGDVCILDTQAVHSFEAAGEDDILINILMRREVFDSAFLSRMTRQGIVSEFLVNAVMEKREQKHYLYFSAHKNKRIHQIMRQILIEYYAADLGMSEVLESYLIILFTELFRILRNDSLETSEIQSNVRILELLEYIDRNYEHCTLKEMGKHFGFHENYLTTLLKERTGHSFLEHIQEKRLQKARVLLENTDIPVSEVIVMCGYQNVNFFYRKFKEAENCTPLQFRNRYRTS